MLSASNIQYLCNQKVTGCLVDTAFFVDHAEIQACLADDPTWHLGALPVGHEFVAFVS